MINDTEYLEDNEMKIHRSKKKQRRNDQLSPESKCNQEPKPKNYMTLEEQVQQVTYEHGWDETIHIAFLNLRQTCQIKQKEHTDAQRYYGKWYRCTTYPVLLLASVISVLAALNATNYSSTLSLTVAILTGFHTLFLALMNFVEYGKRSEKHSLSANGYAGVERYINSQILVKPSERDSPKFNFQVVSTEFDAIAGYEPLVPMGIINKYETDKPKNIVIPQYQRLRTEEMN